FLLFFFSMMRHGLMVVAVGVNPRAAESAGINVEKVRTLCNTLGSGLIGLAGAYLAIDILQGFTYTLVAGYGWIAFALVIFGRWKVHYVYLGSLLFTATTALATRATILGFEAIPLNYIVILPHISVLVALTLAMIWAKESGMPSALGQPYIK
ncbi:MAG: ABC transporter permease, partial [Candidatus Bathyarchaeia archaeon]